ncbi:hypothetical protein [Polyangium mundeleinium]|uniref:Uncharacterized protein n=1 Tax=Polyangium mundeleinium TaxID=2995306 RepID=A0ABT5EXX3_9BACT|nr:hypothetical protein [Polyangium mundeleinium]MDC0745661.1 hypothetical protein [Polyangium mundeleinium]
MPRFFVEEASFRLDAPPPVDTLEERLQDFIALIEACRNKGEPIVLPKDLYEIEIAPGLPLYDFLFRPSTELKVEHLLLRALQVALNRCVEWTPPTGIAPIEVTTVDLVHALLDKGHGAACLCLGLRSDPLGLSKVRAGDDAPTMHFLTTREMLPGFYRSLFELEDLDKDAYMANAAHAFPDIAFAPGLSAQFSRFTTSYRDVRPEVTQHLAVLNDHFQAIYQQADHQPDKTQKLLNSSHHVDASRESDLTRHNRKAMRERDVSVDHVLVAGSKVPVGIGRPVRCEWHTKIKPTTDRIHFHPGDKDVAGGRLFVGIFHAHLQT